VLLRITAAIHRRLMRRALKNPKSWAKVLEMAGISEDEFAYGRALALECDIQTGKYTLSAENDFYLSRGFHIAATAVYPALRRRHWRTLVSPSGSFIGSDNPVIMDGPKGQKVGFTSAEIVIFTVNRFLALYGTNLPLRSRLVNRKFVAYHNSCTMLHADEQLYSHLPGFCWLDAQGRIQNDWHGLSKDCLIQAIGA
jgi:hypothetical protein